MSQTPFNLGGIGGLGGLSGLGMGSANFMEMQQRMQREVREGPKDAKCQLIISCISESFFPSNFYHYYW